MPDIGMTDADLFSKPTPQSDAGMTDTDLFNSKSPVTSDQFSPSASDIDEAVRTTYGEGANQSPEAQQAIAATLVNRAIKNKTSITQQIDPKQYQAWGDPNLFAKMNALQPSDPIYQKILANIQPVLNGKIVLPYTKYLNRDSTPANSSALTTWAAQPGAKIGAQEFYSDDSAGTPAPEPVAGPVQLPSIPHPTDPNNDIQLDSSTDNAANSSDNPTFPVYDPYNKVMRNKDGSIHSLGDARSSITSAEGTIQGNVRQGSDDYDPKNIKAWMDAHPEDISNKTIDVPIDSSNTGRAITGLAQGLSNVKDSILGVASPISGDLRSDLAKNLVYRQNNDINYQGNTAYGLGKFGGEMLGTAPILAVPGLGEFGESALAARMGIAPVSQFAGGTLGGSGAVRALSLGAKGALQGAETAGLTSAGSSAPLGNQLTGGAVGGAIAAPLLHSAGSAANSVFQPTVRQNVAELADKAVNKFGLDLRNSQIQGTVDSAANEADNKLVGTSGSLSAKNAANQEIQGTKAIGSTFGVKPEEMPNGLTPEVMAKAKSDLGKQLNDFNKNRTISGSNLTSTFTNLDDIPSQAELAGLTSDQVKTLKSTIANIKKTSGTSGQFSGDNYQSLIADGSPFDRLQANPDSGVRYYAGKIHDILNGAFDQAHDPNIPDDQWRELADRATSTARDQVRLQYKNMMAVSPLTTQYNAKGVIPLSSLQDAVNNKFLGRAFYGAGDLGDLSDIGQAFKNPSLASGSSSSLLNHIGKIAGGLGGLQAAGEFGLHTPWVAPAAAGAGLVGLGVKKAGQVGQDLWNNSNFLRGKLLSGYNPNPVVKYATNHFSVPASVIAARNTLDAMNDTRKKEKTN